MTVLPDIDGIIEPVIRSMFDTVVREAARQGAAGYIDDNIATARNSSLVTEVDVPTKVMGATATPNWCRTSGALARRPHSGRQLLSQGGHVGAGGDEEQRLFAWLGHGVFPKAPTTD